MAATDTRKDSPWRPSMLALVQATRALKKEAGSSSACSRHYCSIGQPAMAP